MMVGFSEAVASQSLPYAIVVDVLWPWAAHLYKCFRVAAWFEFLHFVLLLLSFVVVVIIVVVVVAFVGNVVVVVVGRVQQ